jgi:hypothetical protein
MSVLQKALEEKGLKIEGDVLPAGQRTCKVFKGLISAVRAAEAKMEDELGNSQRELNDSLRRNNDLINKVHQLEGELVQYRLKERLGQPAYEKLTSAERRNVLAAVATNGDSDSDDE